MKKLTVLIILAFLPVIGCGSLHKHPADIAAVAIVPATQSYLIAEKSLLNLHDACKAIGENCPAALKPIVKNWNRIDDLNDKASEQLSKVHQAWLDLSRLKTPQTEAEFAKQLDLLSRMVADLSAFIPSKESK